MNIYLHTGPRVLHAPLTNLTVIVLRLRTTECCVYLVFVLDCLCQTPVTIDLIFISRRQCQVLSQYVKPRLHLIESDAESILCTTMSSPNHTMSSFSQALLMPRQVLSDIFAASILI